MKNCPARFVPEDLIPGEWFGRDVKTDTDVINEVRWILATVSGQRSHARYYACLLENRPLDSQYR